MRTGAPFVRHGITGHIVDRLPLGRQCVRSNEDEVALAAYLAGLREIMNMDRREIRAIAAEQFATEPPSMLPESRFDDRRAYNIIMHMSKAFLTTAEAARRLGVSSGRVRQFITAGRLAACKFGRDWAISELAIAEFARHERRAGNPNFRRGKGRRARNL